MVKIMENNHEQMDDLGGTIIFGNTQLMKIDIYIYFWYTLNVNISEYYPFPFFSECSKHRILKVRTFFKLQLPRSACHVADLLARPDPSRSGIGIAPNHSKSNFIGKYKVA